MSDGEDGISNHQMADSILATVHVRPELSIHNYRSCSLPSALMSGCFDANSSISLPSSPKNLSCYHNSNKNIVTHGSSGKIPDLVEHTQGADIYRDPSFKEALTLQALALDRGRAHFLQCSWQSKKEVNSSVDDLPHVSNHYSTAEVSHHGNWSEEEHKPAYTSQSDSPPKLNINYAGIVIDSPKYIKNRDRCGCERVLTQHHREKSASTGALARSGLSHIVDDDQASHRRNHKGEPQCTTLPRRHKNGQISCDGKHYPQEKSDKIQLITG